MAKTPIKRLKPRKIKKNVETYEDFVFGDLCTYAGIDNIVTSDLLKNLMPRLLAQPKYLDYEGNEPVETRAPSVWKELLDVKTLALEFTCDLKITGMFYDQEANNIMGANMYNDMSETKKRIDIAAGMEVPMSGAAFYNWLYRIRGYRSVIKTKNGDEATSGEALEALMDIYEDDISLLTDVKRYIDVRSMYNGFIDGYVSKFVKYDSRIHCDYNLNGTSSHRLSSTNPNMLNMPRGYYGYNIRNNYTATPGYSLIAFDFSSCEVKILAALSGDVNMILACERGYDFHSFSASMMIGITYEEFLEKKEQEELFAKQCEKEGRKKPEQYYKNQRQFAKAVTFGILYGSSVGGIAHTLNISVQEAQKIIDTYFNSFPGVKGFINDCHKRALANNMVYSPFGQRKQEHGARQVFKGSAVYNAALRNSQNVSIQGPASTFGLICFAMLNKELRRRGIGRAVLTVYDSIEFEVLRGKEAEAIELGFYYLDDWPVEAFDWLNFKVGCDGELGNTFGNLGTVERGITQDECEDTLVGIFKNYMPPCMEDTDLFLKAA